MVRLSIKQTVRLSCVALLACFCAVAGAAAQSTLPKLLPDCGGIFGLCGFVDSRTRVEVIPRRFEQVVIFGEGLAGVRINGRWGFIDEAGAVVIAPRFDLVGTFYQGLAEVLVGNKVGVIDRQGNIVLAPQFARAIPFTKDVVLAREGAWPSGYVGHGALPNPAQETLFYPGGFGLYSIRTGWLTKQHFQLQRYETQGRGLIWATTQDQSSGPFGLLRADGTWQVEPQYSYVRALLDERAIVRIPDGAQGGRQPSTELDGAVDADGKLVVPLRHRQLFYWANGLGLVREGGKVGLIDKAGRIIGGRLFDDAKRAETGDVSQVLLDGKWVGLDRDGRVVANPDDGVLIAQCPTGVKFIRQSGMVQVVGTDRTIVYSTIRTSSRTAVNLC
jgi:hypothetical protein